IIVNFIIMTAILVFVVLYSRIQSSASYKRQVEYFENTTVTMERVTENYLAGEQRICDVWARYIDNKDNNMIGTVLNGNDTPDIYVNYSWMYGRDQYKSSIDHAENLADPALNLDLDCVRSNII
nr:hypothetical protein [Lachnospiraceae bacterium]